MEVVIYSESIYTVAYLELCEGYRTNDDVDENRLGRKDADTESAGWDCKI